MSLTEEEHAQQDKERPGPSLAEDIIRMVCRDVMRKRVIYNSELTVLKPEKP